MQEVLIQLGLSKKEAVFYVHLLDKGKRTALQISKDLGETRTNTYMILDKLAAHGLVETDPNIPVRRYAVADPGKLKALLKNRQLQLRQAQVSLSSVLPELSSQYSLGQNKPGVVYLEGINGYRKSLQDMTKSGQPVCVIASNVAHQNPKAWAALQSYALRRKDSGVHYRIIFNKDIEPEIDLKTFEARGYEVRFWGNQPIEGEIALYGEKIALTVYVPTVVVTVITNSILAATFISLFDQLWIAGRLKS